MGKIIPHMKTIQHQPGQGYEEEGGEAARELSLADCTFKDEEFRQTLSLLHGCTDPRKKYALPALLLLAMKMIAWLDDAAHLRKNTLMVCPEFNVSLSACMRWNKNVSEEKYSPHQIILGLMNTNFDILLIFSLVLYVMVDCCDGDFGEFVFCPGNRKPDTMKSNYYHMLKENVWDVPEFC
eukprot:1412189-Ditylum_brightwellii.AAC.1